MKIELLKLLIAVILVSCGTPEGHTDEDASPVNKELQLQDSDAIARFRIKGIGIILRDGPGNSYEKLVNKKASDALGETVFLEVDNSCMVEILDTDKDWSKIAVVEPEWLVDTHTGWIESKHILTNEVSNNSTNVIPITKDDFEIIKIEEEKLVTNFYVLWKGEMISQQALSDFDKRFRKEYCIGSCNVSYYDTKSIKSLIDVYPLSQKEYLKFADHFIGMSTMDSPAEIWYYSYQDIKYKEYGGKNWKKDPL